MGKYLRKSLRRLNNGLIGRKLIRALLVLLAFIAANASAAESPRGSALPDFARLPDLHSLHSLQLGRDTTDDMLMYVEGLQNLRDLAMQESRVSSAGLRHLSTLTQLEKLNLSRTHVGDAGLEYLKPLINLKRLRLANSAVTGLGLPALKPLKKLEVLDVSGLSCILDDDLAQLEELAALRELNLQNAMLCGPGLKHLAHLTRLERLVLPRTGLDTGAVEALRKAFPRLTIEQPEDYRAARAVYEQGDSGPGTSGEWDPFWMGDYETAIKIFSHYLDSPQHTWHTTLWLGHAYALQGDNRRAAETYHRALRELQADIAKPQPPAESPEDVRPPRKLTDACPLIHYIGEFESRELKDCKAALSTLLQVREFPPEYGSSNFPSEVDAVDLLAAEACEQSQDYAGALNHYLRLRFAVLRRPNRLADKCKACIAALRDKLPDVIAPEGRSFAILTVTSSQTKFTPNAESLRNGQDDVLAEDVFTIVAPCGKTIASFQMTIAPDVAYPGGSCLWGDSDKMGGGWLDWRSGQQATPSQPELKPRTFKPIAAGTDVVYMYFPRAKKRPSIKELTVCVLKWADEKASPTVPVMPVRRLQSVGPFDSVPLEIPGIGSTGLADAALTKLTDGRWLIAVPVPGPDGRRSIKLTTSRDQKSWEPLRDYDRHDMFDAIEPSLFQEGDETWMFYRSNRFELNSVSTAEVRLGAKGLDDRHGSAFPLTAGVVSYFYRFVVFRCGR